MVVESNNFRLKLEEITKEKIATCAKHKTEQKALELALKWKENTPYFTFHSSGSTGSPRTIEISRKKIILSTIATFEYIDPIGSLQTSLLCISPEFIGGAMVVFRALIKGLDLYISEPSSKIAEGLPRPSQKQFDLVSMVPLQFEMLSRQELTRFKIVLVGGAPLNSGLRIIPKNTRIFSTYGMTETISHVALREVHESRFRTVGDTVVDLDSNNRLKFKGTITDHKWLKTNDLGEVISSKMFKWIGRHDFIINSGGVKVNPEDVESKLQQSLKGQYIISARQDSKLGERLVLVIEGEKEMEKIDFGMLDKYETPKEVLYVETLPRTASGKIDRIQVKKLLFDEN